MLPELWLLVSTFCYSPLISYNSQGIEVGRLKCLECPPKCIQKVEISTFPVTAKDGETVYHVGNTIKCEHDWTTYWTDDSTYIQCKICRKLRRKIDKWEDVE